MSSEQNTKTKPHHEVHFNFNEGSQPPQKIHIDHRNIICYMENSQAEGGLVIAEKIENSTISMGGQVGKSDLDLLTDALELGARNEQVRLGQAFQSLWSLVEIQFANHQNLQLIATQYMQDPDVWVLPLRKALAQSKLDKESSIIDASYKVLNK